MKNIYIIVIICFFSNYGNVYAQTINNLDISIINFTNNQFFEFLPYSLTLNIEDTTNNFIVEGDENSLITLDTNHNYKVVFHGAFHRSIITIYKMVNGEKVNVFSKKFSFHPLPITPLIKMKSSSYFVPPGGTISREDLKHAIVSAGIINYNIEKFYDVIFYSMILYKNGSIEEYKVTGAQIDDEHYKYLENLKSGQPIIFDKIMIKGYEQFEIKTYPLVIYIK